MSISNPDRPEDAVAAPSPLWNNADNLTLLRTALPQRLQACL